MVVTYELVRTLLLEMDHKNQKISWTMVFVVFLSFEVIPGGLWEYKFNRVPGNHTLSRSSCLVFSSPWCPSCAGTTSAVWRASVMAALYLNSSILPFCWCDSQLFTNAKVWLNSIFRRCLPLSFQHSWYYFYFLNNRVFVGMKIQWNSGTHLLFRLPELKARQLSLIACLPSSFCPSVCL